MIKAENVDQINSEENSDLLDKQNNLNYMQPYLSFSLKQAVIIRMQDVIRAHYHN